MNQLIRKNIQQLKPYSSARDEYKGRQASVFLDANESPYGAPLNRYPDPLQLELKHLVSTVKQVPADSIFLGNGSDEAIDLVFRIFCEPRIDNVVAIDPTYGMYEVCADINDVEYRKVALDEHFQLSAADVLAECDAHTKVIFLCSPNNPTGNDLDRHEVEKILQTFRGITVIDEAYADFSSRRPLRLEIANYPRMIVLNTFSKAYGSAAIRLGMAFASAEIIGLFNKVKYPYNVNLLTQQRAVELLQNDMLKIHQRINLILEERTSMMLSFARLPLCVKVFPSDANFFLARVTDANAIYEFLVEKGIIVRNRSRIHLCADCLRITIGTKDENAQLLSALIEYSRTHQ